MTKFKKIDYIHIQSEREREREREMKICVVCFYLGQSQNSPVDKLVYNNEFINPMPNLQHTTYHTYMHTYIRNRI